VDQERRGGGKVGAGEVVIPYPLLLLSFGVSDFQLAQFASSKPPHYHQPLVQLGESLAVNEVTGGTFNTSYLPAESSEEILVQKVWQLAYHQEC